MQESVFTLTHEVHTKQKTHPTPALYSGTALRGVLRRSWERAGGGVQRRVFISGT